MRACLKGLCIIQSETLTRRSPHHDLTPPKLPTIIPHDGLFEVDREKWTPYFIMKDSAGTRADCARAAAHICNQRSGASIKYVHKVLGFFDPLSLCELAADLYHKIHATSLTLSAFTTSSSPPM